MSPTYLQKVQEIKLNLTAFELIELNAKCIQLQSVDNWIYEYA